MTQRDKVRIRIEQLLDVHDRREPAFLTDFRCKLCRFTAHALDPAAALDAFAEHLATSHRASGGTRRRTK